MVQQAILKDDVVTPEMKQLEDINMVADVPLSFYHPDKGWVHPTDIPGQALPELIKELVGDGGVKEPHYLLPEDAVESVDPENTPWPPSQGYGHMMPKGWQLQKTNAADLLKGLFPVESIPGATSGTQMMNVVRQFLLRMQRAAAAQGLPFLESLNAYLSPVDYQMDRD